MTAGLFISRLLNRRGHIIKNNAVKPFVACSFEISNYYYSPRRNFCVGHHRNPENEESKRIVKMALMGNLAITAAKAACWLGTVDAGNQALLMIGLRGAENAPDKKHQYGYGRSIYFWSLVSALGTFWFGAGISGWHSMMELINPSLELKKIGWEVWTVLGISCTVDGFVLLQTIHSMNKKKPEGMSFWRYCLKLRDPTTAAVLMEDGAACIGVVVAGMGIAASQYTNMIVWDSLAGLTVAGVMGVMGLYLARLNQRYLLGHSVDSEIVNRIGELIIARPGIEGMHSVKSQWIGPNSFSYKAEVEIDGTYLAARLLDRYKKEFIQHIAASKKLPDTNPSKVMDEEIHVLLSWYAEDVIRIVEIEVKEIEASIRAEFPEAMYIEIEPDSSQLESGECFSDPSSGTRAKSSGFKMNYMIDTARKMPALRKYEIESIKRMQEDIKNYFPPHV